MLNRSTIKDDIMAGITIAIVVLPQGVAYAMIAGLPPIYGLYSAIVIPIVASLFGSSFHLISGPTAALSIVVFSSISGFAEPGTAMFISLVFLLTFIVGLIQLLLGIIRLGNLVSYVSHSVIVGFTSGAAVLIATSQLKHVFGLDIPLGKGFFQTWNFVISHIDQSNWFVFGIALFTVIFALVLKRFYPKSPFLLLAMIGGSLIAYFFFREDQDIPLLNKLPAILPSFSFPEFSYSSILKITPHAFAIAFLGLTEAVAISRAIAIKSNQKLNANQEFVGQGMSNLVGSIFMNFVGSGSFTRSAINFQSGAKTPLSGVISAIALVLILLFIAPLTAYLPISTLGGVILIVAYNLIDFKEINQIAKSSYQELSVLIVTFLSTLFFHLEYAIYFGVLLSLIYYIIRVLRKKLI